jgi:hypothetical protein
MRQDPALAQRIADFVDHCMTVRHPGDVPAMPSYTWQLSGTLVGTGLRRRTGGSRGHNRR